MSWKVHETDGRTVNERWMNGERTEEGAAMSITDEMREWTRNRVAEFIIGGVNDDDLIAIADRIDAEHKKAVERARMDGMDTTFGNGWVKLPVDADGVPIHVGDEVEGLHGENANAKFLVLHEDGVWDVGDRGWVPHFLRHHQPDSWERIMDDAEKLARGDNAAVMELVERCRRLAGE